jgi:seryl-tRNA synthetase
MSEYNEWSKHVLKELERLNKSYESLSKDVHEVKSKVTHYSPEEVTTLKIKVQGLTEKDSDQESRLREMENKIALSTANVAKIDTLEKTLVDMEKREANFLGKWGVIAVIGSLLISGLVGWLFKSVEPSEHPAHEPHDRRGSATKVLTADEISALRAGPK